jgi:hypothetical protein
MRDISLILAAAALISAGVGGWIASTTAGGKAEYPLHHGNAAVGGGHYALPLLD